MEKSIVSSHYTVVLSELRNARLAAGLSQEMLANRIGQTQSFVSKVERGERRLDVVELRMFCAAIGIDLSSFVKQIDELLQKSGEARS